MPLTLTIAPLCGLLIGTLLLLLPLAKAVIALLGLMVVTTIIRKPIVGFCLFVLVATCIPFSTINFGIRITISEALLILTWGATALRFSSVMGALKVGLTEKRILLFLLFSITPFVAGQAMIQVPVPGNGLVNWVRWILNVSTIFLVPLLLDTPKKRDALILMILLGNLLMLSVSIAIFLSGNNVQTIIALLEKLQYAHPEGLIDIIPANYARMGSPWIHPNLTGGALALFMPVILFYGISQTGWRRVLGYVTALLAAAGLLFSISRGAMVSLTLVLIWYAYLRVPYIGKTLVTGAVLAAALIVFYPPLQDRLSTMFSTKDASTQVRAEEYREFPNVVAHYPLGIGFKIDPPVPNTELLGISNLWLNYVYKISVIGMLLFIAITTAWWREVRPPGKVRAVRQGNALWLGTLGSVLAALGTGLFDHYFSFTMVLVGLFWMLMGINLQQARELGVARHLDNDSTEAKIIAGAVHGA